MRMFAALCSVVAGGALLAGCSGGDSTPRPAGRTEPAAGASVLVRHLEVPWGLAFLPDHSALVGERMSGKLLQITPAGATTTLGTVPGVAADGEGGLLGLALSPRFSTDHLVYAYLTADSDNRVIRFRLDNGRIGSISPVLTGIGKAVVHNGGRLAFGPDGDLYVTVGDATVREHAQQTSSPNGKVLRITADGKPAPGNPFPGSPVYTYGHRNLEGLAWGPGNRLYESEFGENTADEVNLLQPGHNYGWPLVEGKSDRFTAPLVTWPTSDCSPSGIAYADGALWVGALRGERLWRIPVRSDGTLGTPRAYLQGQYGRIRTVAAAPDGSLWLTTSNRDGRGQPADDDDRVVRFTP